MKRDRHHFVRLAILVALGTIFSTSGHAAPNVRSYNDFNGDGKSDLAVFHAAAGNWYIRTLDGRMLAFPVQWGYPTAVPVPADYNGDGKADLAVYDRNGGYWYIRSLSATQPILWAFQWGWSTAVPVSGDYDNDGHTDIGVYDLNTSSWYVYSIRYKRVLLWASKWGFKGDVRTWEKKPYPSTVLPMPFDFDQDGRTDQAFYYRGTSMVNSAWSIKGSAGVNFVNKIWGSSGSIGAPGNYIQQYGGFTYPTGISTYKIGSKTAVPEWGTPYVIGSTPGYGVFMGVFGRTLPVPGQDFDGNGWDDYALFDYVNGEWTIKFSTGDGNTLRNGAVSRVTFGFSGARPANLFSTIYHSCNYSPAPW